LGSVVALAGGPALAALPAADPLVLVDGWLVKLSDIKPATFQPAP
jgi:hypothetical protein